MTWVALLAALFVLCVAGFLYLAWREERTRLRAVAAGHDPRDSDCVYWVGDNRVPGRCGVCREPDWASRTARPKHH